MKYFIFIFFQIITWTSFAQSDDVIRIGLLPSAFGEGMPLNEFQEFERNLIKHSDKNSIAPYLLQMVFGDTDWTASQSQSSRLNSNRNPQVAHKATVWLTINLFEVSTGAIKKSITLTASSGKVDKYRKAPPGPESIFINAINSAQALLWSKTKSAINVLFPIDFSIKKIIKQEDKKAESVLINAGRFHGLKKGNTVFVYYEKEYEVRGKPTIRTIAISVMTLVKVNNPFRSGKRWIHQSLKASINFKTIFTFSLIAILNFSLQAQVDENPSLGVLKFEASEVTEVQAQLVSNRIEIAIYNSNRFQVVTRQFLKAIQTERERDKTILDLDKMAIEQGKAVGADFIVKGKVTYYKRKTSQTKSTNRVSKPSYYVNTQVKFYFEIIDVKTGVIRTTSNYEGSLNGVDFHIKNFVRRKFPFIFNVLEVVPEAGKKKSNMVLVDGGFNQGLHRRVFLKVYEIREENVGGKTINREVHLGKMRVEAVDFGGDFSKCEIKKGKKAILQKLKEGKKIICKVPPTRSLLGMEYEYNY